MRPADYESLEALNIQAGCGTDENLRIARNDAMWLQCGSKSAICGIFLRVGFYK